MSEGIREDRVLANIIKETHAVLRNKVKGNHDKAEEIWRDHVRSIENCDRKTYAEAMKNLSNEHWSNESRLTWISDKLNLYFVEGDRQRFITRLCRRQNENESGETLETADNFKERFNILDVGSCHNPLKKCLKNREQFEMTAVDLSPATPDVLQGDFLQISVSEKSLKIDEDNRLDNIQSASFDAVVFCLLLEYLPNPKLRLKAIEQADKCLKPMGLLIIITPDSSHQGKNMSQMKSWRLALAQMGFLRIYIEKLKHVHCLAFVKVSPRTDFVTVFEKEIDLIKRKMEITCKPLENAFYIPQDFN